MIQIVDTINTKKKCTLAHQGSADDNKAPREENITLKGARIGLTANYIEK